MAAIDIRWAIGHLVPTAYYGWKGDGSPVSNSDYNNIDWRDPVITKPTLGELQTAWVEIEAEQQQIANTLIAVRNTAAGAEGVALGNLTTGQRNALLAVMLWNQGGIARDGTIAPLDSWLNS